MTNGESVNSVKGDDYSHFIIMKKKIVQNNEKTSIKNIEKHSFHEEKKHEFVIFV